MIAAVGLLAGELIYLNGQTARRRKVTRCAVLQSGFFQPFFNTCKKGLCELFQCLGRQLFGTQFNQKILSLYYSASFSLASTSSRNSGVAIGKPRRARASR